MPFLALIRKCSQLLVYRFSWGSLLLGVIIHCAVGYEGLVFFDEKALLAPMTYLYFYLTTTLTVGYGDLLPVTEGGRLFTALWLMLGGITLLTVVIGKLTNLFVALWRKGMKGKHSYAHREAHTVLIGWDPATSERIIDLLLKDDTSSDEAIVLCDNTLDENPLPGKAGFVHGEQLTSRALLERAGVSTAERILIHTGNDDVTLAVVLSVHALEPQGHVVAHFNDPETARLARLYAPALECTSSMSVEMLVRASQDPGSSSVITELLAVDQGATQYRTHLPTTMTGRLGDLYQRMKEEHNAILIGYMPEDGTTLLLNPHGDTHVEGGEIFYIANERITF
ncbi:ion channel [Larsenimonas rhizosphaerae]|uniref:ion channel n=1 Tax=Larsenimonas rhizosphaerae TaxID=2944682 RepID=UPI002034393E|nr:ion channel [Larsenimonas rhizosphaerae]MCM2131647.1 ion channel [Larsenimonas rhizosphaerae]